LHWQQPSAIFGVIDSRAPIDETKPLTLSVDPMNGTYDKSEPAPDPDVTVVPEVW
jgi:hypothetical protein